jgi:hypothetical protein
MSNGEALTNGITPISGDQRTWEGPIDCLSISGVSIRTQCAFLDCKPILRCILAIYLELCGVFLTSRVTPVSGTSS